VVYAIWGLALPLLLGARDAWRLSFNTEGAIFAAAVFFAWLVPIIEGRLRHQRLELTTDVRTLSAREFEELAGELFRREGWNVAETGGHGKSDGNIDLLLSRSSERRIVQCKRWTARDVGVDQIRELGGTLLREGRAGHDGILLTCARFTPAAIAEAERLEIELINGRDLVRRLEKAGATGLLNAAKHASAAWPCPECATPMVLGHSPHGWWLRCPEYNAGCRGKHNLGQDSRSAVERIIAGV
jgi:restriction system protein